MSNAAKGIYGSGPSGNPDDNRVRARPELSLDAEIRRNIRASRGYSSTPMFKNGGGRTLKDTIAMAINAHRHGPDVERC